MEQRERTMRVPDSSSSSSLSEEDEERDRKRVKVYHISQELKESTEGLDQSERYDILSDIALNISYEREMMISEAIHQIREEMKQLQKKSCYRLLQKVMNQKGQEGDDFFTFIKYYKNNLAPRS